jgi:hypothetical protein
VPPGELECWLPELEVGGHGPEWLTAVFQKMGTDPGEATYLRPVEGGVWRFMQQAARWIADPRRKGMRAEVIPLDHLLAPPAAGSIVEAPAPEPAPAAATEPERAPERRPRDKPRDDRQNGRAHGNGRHHEGRRGENALAPDDRPRDRRRKPARREEAEAEPEAVIAPIEADASSDAATIGEPRAA